MRILLLGTTSENQRVIKWLVENHHDVVGVIGDTETLNAAGKYGIPKYDINDITETTLSELNPKVIVSYLYNKRIKEPLISFAEFGCINFHPAPLPDYKGRGGCNFAILEKKDEWGATAHYVDSGFDTGSIIKVFRFNFDYKRETAISLKRKTFDVMFDLFKSIICRMEDDRKLPGVAQKSADGKYYSYNDMLNQMAIRENDDVDAKIQAFWYPPYSGAYIEINGKKYTVINDFILNNLKENQ